MNIFHLALLLFLEDKAVAGHYLIMYENRNKCSRYGKLVLLSFFSLLQRLRSKSSLTRPIRQIFEGWENVQT